MIQDISVRDVNPDSIRNEKELIESLAGKADVLGREIEIVRRKQQRVESAKSSIQDIISKLDTYKSQNHLTNFIHNFDFDDLSWRIGFKYKQVNSAKDIELQKKFMELFSGTRCDGKSCYTKDGKGIINFYF